ncbi:hypothetical protein CfE428DRAFT_0176 [Chthoniobacter flavus Ellin428]|uniref:Uncharacterized protein n=1 Tax=Chthoniobacter flavus Ellin428 TaxID=497964 RepID=B4CU13_9BACT|nr:hypothetical protein [Chthoniobacter flavus]EDY22051.1 hypothetical protein CfE428DRAFT_0176 [Chthoniobacter flavus Ellin428]
MIRLQPHGQRARQTQRVAELGHYARLCRDEDEVLVAHQLAHRGDHLGREPRCERGKRRGIRLVAKQPVAQFSDTQPADRLERRAVLAIKNQPGDFVLLVRNERFLEKARERHFGETHLRGHALLGAGRGEPGELVARTQWRRLGEQCLEIRKNVRPSVESQPIAHRMNNIPRVPRNASRRSVTIAQRRSRNQKG